MQNKEDEFEAEYTSALSDLKSNTKPLILMLTDLAKENKMYSKIVTKVIIKNIFETAFKLPTLYLVDSIVKNVGNPYKRLFGNSIDKVFSHVFEKVDLEDRRKLYKIRHTWNGNIFPHSKLFYLDTLIHGIDSNWPIPALVKDTPQKESYKDTPQNESYKYQKIFIAPWKAKEISNTLLNATVPANLRENISSILSTPSRDPRLGPDAKCIKSETKHHKKKVKMNSDAADKTAVKSDFKIKTVENTVAASKDSSLEKLHSKITSKNKKNDSVLGLFGKEDIDLRQIPTIHQLPHSKESTCPNTALYSQHTHQARDKTYVIDTGGKEFSCTFLKDNINPVACKDLKNSSFCSMKPPQTREKSSVVVMDTREDVVLNTVWKEKINPVTSKDFNNSMLYSVKASQNKENKSSSVVTDTKENEISFTPWKEKINPVALKDLKNSMLSSVKTSQIKENKSSLVIDSKENDATCTTPKEEEINTFSCKALKNYALSQTRDRTSSVVIDTTGKGVSYSRCKENFNSVDNKEVSAFDSSVVYQMEERNSKFFPYLKRNSSSPPSATWEKFSERNKQFKIKKQSSNTSDQQSQCVKLRQKDGYNNYSSSQETSSPNYSSRNISKTGSIKLNGIELPTISDEFLNYIQCENQTKTIDIDGKPREIRTYGEQAIILMDWDKPYTISFEPIQCNIVFDNGKFTLPMRIGEDYRKFQADGEWHIIKLGVPTQELMLDGKGYRCIFGGNPITVHFAGKNRTIGLHGRSPKVNFGQNINTEFLLGSVELTVDSNKVAKLYLDGKPQIFMLEGKPYVIKFISAFQKVNINGAKIFVEFGGFPICVLVDGKRKLLRFSNLPSFVIPGSTNVRGMDNEELVQNHYSNVPSHVISDTSTDFPSSLNSPPQAPLLIGNKTSQTAPLLVNGKTTFNVPPPTKPPANISPQNVTSVNLNSSFNAINIVNTFTQKTEPSLTQVNTSSQIFPGLPPSQPCKISRDSESYVRYSEFSNNIQHPPPLQAVIRDNQVNTSQKSFPGLLPTHSSNISEVFGSNVSISEPPSSLRHPPSIQPIIRNNQVNTSQHILPVLPPTHSSSINKIFGSNVSTSELKNNLQHPPFMQSTIRDNQVNTSQQILPGLPPTHSSSNINKTFESNVSSSELPNNFQHPPPIQSTIIDNQCPPLFPYPPPPLLSKADIFKESVSLPTNPEDVRDLFDRLLEFGVIEDVKKVEKSKESKIKNNPTKKDIKANSRKKKENLKSVSKECPKLLNFLDDIPIEDMIEIENLRRKNDKMKNSLHQGEQCLLCGERYFDKKLHNRTHHFRKKNIDQDGSFKTPYNRESYPHINDFLLQKIKEDDDRYINSEVDEQSCTNNSSGENSGNDHISNVEVSGDPIHKICSICHEIFDQFEICNIRYYEEAVQVENINYHQRCYQNFLKKKEEKEKLKVFEEKQLPKKEIKACENVMKEESCVDIIEEKESEINNNIKSKDDKNIDKYIPETEKLYFEDKERRTNLGTEKSKIDVEESNLAESLEKESATDNISAGNNYLPMHIKEEPDDGIFTSFETSTLLADIPIKIEIDYDDQETLFEVMDVDEDTRDDCIDYPGASWTQPESSTTAETDFVSSIDGNNEHIIAPEISPMSSGTKLKIAISLASKIRESCVNSANEICLSSDGNSSSEDDIHKSKDSRSTSKNINERRENINSLDTSDCSEKITDDDCISPFDDCNLDFALTGTHFVNQPPVMRGIETSSLCSIM